MRQSLFHSIVLSTLIFVVSGSGLSMAQDWLKQAIPQAEREHDFGIVARAAATEHKFSIKNVLNQNLRIRSVRASCGCTTPIVEDKVIQPGQTGTILARFNTRTFTGSRKATLTVTFDRPFYAELQLNVRGYIRSDVVFDPGKIAFGEVAEGESKSEEVIVDYAGRGNWAIERVESPFPFIETSFEELSRSAGRIKYKLNVKLTADSPAGYLQNQLVLHTNDRRLSTVPLPLMANIQAQIQFSPKNLALGSVKPGEPIKKRLVIRSQRPFRILDISSETADVRYEPINDSKPTHLVHITVAPNNTEAKGKVNGQLILKTDLNDSPLALDLSYELEKQSEIEE